MEQAFQTTSFIPKKPLTTTKPPASRGLSIFSFFATLILIGTIAVSGLLYVYNKKLASQVTDLETTLDRAKEKFNPVAIESIKQLDKRINTAEKVLSNHITLSPILVNVLNANTLKKVQYTQFSHTVNGSGASAKIQVRLAGKAESLPYVALQSKKLAENKYVENPIFSDIVTAKDNTVTFNLLFDINSNLIMYSKLVQSLSSLGSNTTPTPLDTTNPGIKPTVPVIPGVPQSGIAVPITNNTEKK
jgi:hypothetical protein